MYLKNKISIVFIADNIYFMPTSVAIESICENKFSDTQIDIYIIAPKIDKKNEDLLKSQARESVSITIIKINTDVSIFQNNYSHVSSTATLKFDLPKIFKELDKILYIDSDVIVQGDLAELFNTDIDDKYAAIVKDNTIENQKSFLKYIDLLSITTSDYFNTGVMLLNLKKMREDSVSEKLFEYKKFGINFFMDQDAFNVCLKNKVHFLNIYNNLQAPLIYTYLSKKEIIEKFNIAEYASIEQLLSRCTILHLAGSNKPWNYYDKYLTPIFKNYYKNTPYRNKPLGYEKEKIKTILQNIFSIRNIDKHKIITFFFIKLKFKQKRDNINKLKFISSSLCPICQMHKSFIPYGTQIRQNAKCPICGSLEQHRFLYFIYNVLFLNTSKKIKLLHIAPENNLYKLIKRNQLIEYVALDINPEQYPLYPLVKECIQWDVRNMPFDDKSFDVIIHNQVMEHIVEEKQFIDECVRVLKDNGVMIINIPYSPELKTTFEDKNITTEEKREKLYYQKDHVRLYGQDMLQKYDYLDITRLDESIMPEKLINLMNLKREITKEKALLDAYFIIRKVIK